MNNMASKFLVFHLLLALTLFAGRLQGCGILPELRFIDAVKGENPAAPINLQIKAGGVWRASAQLNPGQGCRIRVKVDDVYYVSAVFGLRFAGFHAYEPARDHGQAAVYWRADNDGFAISHDNTHWKMLALWESE